MKKIIYHKIDPKLVKKTIDEKISEHKEEIDLFKKEIKELESKEPSEENAKSIKSLKSRIRYRRCDIKQEQNYYSKVQIIENPNNKKEHGKFSLIYDKKETTGTGPFKTLAQAKAWFTNQGR